MRIEKEKRKVNIVCVDGSLVKGFVHMHPGLRLQDFINDSKKHFIVVTGIEKGDIILNKTCIKWIEEA